MRAAEPADIIGKMVSARTFDGHIVTGVMVKFCPEENYFTVDLPGGEEVLSFDEVVVAKSLPEAGQAPLDWLVLAKDAVKQARELGRMPKSLCYDWEKR